jgi:hypothetical protein
MEELAADYVSGALHPSDVKLALAKSLNVILQVTLPPSFPLYFLSSFYFFLCIS